MEGGGPGDVGERLRRIERELAEIRALLERLETLLSMFSGAAGEAVRLASALSLPVEEAVRAAERLLEASSRLGGSPDPITLAVLEALSGCEQLSVSEIARRVRRLRGAASRTTVRSRLRVLVERGVVERLEGPGGRPRYRLRGCR